MQAFPWHLEMALRSHTRVYNANFTHIHSSLSRRGPFGHDTISVCRGSPRIPVWYGDSFFFTTTPDPFHGELSFLHSSVQDIYQVTFLESPGIGTQIILALEPRLRRAQSGSCHLVSIGGLFPEVCQVLSFLHSRLCGQCP